MKVLNEIFNAGAFPEEWTKARVVEIYKNKGNATYPENYRPINLLQAATKETCQSNG